MQTTNTTTKDNGMDSQKTTDWDGYKKTDCFGNREERDSFNEEGEDYIKRAQEAFSKVGEEAKKGLEMLEDIIGTARLAANTDYRECNVSGFRDCLEWIKQNIIREKHSGAVIRREEEEGDNLLLVYLLDKDGNLCCNENDRVLMIKCRAVNRDLLNLMGDKNTVVLK